MGFSNLPGAKETGPRRQIQPEEESRVLKEITPAALSGSATLELLAAGLSWTLSAPARFVMAGMEPTPQD